MEQLPPYESTPGRPNILRSVVDALHLALTVRRAVEAVPVTPPDAPMPPTKELAWMLEEPGLVAILENREPAPDPLGQLDLATVHRVVQLFQQDPEA